MQFGDVGQRRFNTGIQSFRFSVLEHIDWQYCHVDAAQVLEINQNLQRPFANHGQDPPGRSVVD